MNKQYKTAPLPFQGQKRNFVPHFKEALKEFKCKHEVDTVVDLFGGSGLLSHTAKRMYPALKVIYNDFDGFHLRLNNVHITNSILQTIRTIVDDYSPSERLNKHTVGQIISLVNIEKEKGYFIDYITLSSSVMFSGKYAMDHEEFCKSTMYNNVKKSDYEVDCYLDGLEITKEYYRVLFNQYKGQSNVLFIVDPPYLSTDVKTYSAVKYWKLKDCLDVLNVLKDDNYVFFTSDKSELIDLFEWLSVNYKARNPFMDAKMNSFRNTVSYNGKYPYLMFYSNRRN
jgi:16S rRNA G966 N2-methylase RsmD